MNIYIGNLSYGIKETDLRKLFEEFGTVVSAKIITDKYTEKSKGFAFVEMENDEEANNAIESLNGKEIDGRQLKVNVARPRNSSKEDR